MREIKFRYRDNMSGKITYSKDNGIYRMVYQRGDCRWQDCLLGTLVGMHNEGKGVLMQYVTKNRWSEFYEGDICHAPDFECNFEIVYSDFAFWAKTEDGGIEHLDEYLSDTAFVVGNIYEGVKK